MWWHAWSECVDLGAKLQNGEHGVIDEIKEVGEVTFRDFVGSWGTLEQRRANDEIQTVKSLLRIIHILKTVWLGDCNLGADHLRILCDVFNGVKIHELEISHNRIDAETWRQLGILVHQCGLKTLKAKFCNPTAECLERFIQETNGTQINELNISYNDIDAETWRQLGILVHQCGLKTLKARYCHPTAECLERFIQETNGAQLDCIVISLKYEDKFPISDVLKLLPLINEKLYICNGINDKKVVEALQRKLNEDLLCPLTIENSLGNYLKASPMDLPQNLPKVDGLKADETNGVVQLKWSPLSIPNVSYYIVVETQKDGKAVGDPIVTNETSCQLLYLQSETKYSFFIWGYTNDAISSRVTWKCLETGEIYEHQQTIQPGILQTNGVRSSDLLDTEANKQGNGEVSPPGQMQTLNDWLKTAGQFESPMQSQLRENSQQGVIKTVEATNSTAAWRGNMGALQESDNPTHRKPEFDLQQFILFRHAEGNLFSGAATSTAPAVPYASVHHNVQQKYIQQDTSNSVQQQPQQYPARDDGMMYNSADQGLQQPVMPVVNSPAQVLQDSQRAATFTAPAVLYASVHAKMQQTYIQQDTSNYVQQLSQRHPDVADDSMYNSADQGFQQLVQPAVNDPAPVLQESQRFDANTSTGATEFTQLTTVNPSADYDMGASAAYGYPVDQSVVNDRPSTSGQVAANSVDQTTNMPTIENRMSMFESMLANFQQAIGKLEEEKRKQGEMIRMQNEKIKIQVAKMKEQEETITKLEKKVATLEGAGVSASADVCQLPFILPMKTKDDVEENENLLEEKENETKLVELLSKVGGTGKVAVWRIMGKLFTDRLAKQYSWTGRKAGKNSLRKLKMKEIIFRAGLMKNVDNEPCEKAVMRWLKNASDREGGRERRNKRKGEKSGAKQTE